MSLDASQTLGGTLTFAKWKGRNYVRLAVKPYNPKSADQEAVREAMKYGVLYFTKGDYIAAGEKTWWGVYGEREKPAVSGFNRFIRAWMALSYSSGSFAYAGIPAAH